jgi:uncharacterized membrane protein YhhN
MGKFHQILVALICLTTVADLWSDWVDVPSRIAEPLTILFLMALLYGAGGGQRGYRALILVGQLLSIIAGTFLMGGKGWFVWGLGFFLVTHLCYISAFMLGVGWRVSDVLWAIPFAVYAAGIYSGVKGGTGPMWGPVLGYRTAISVMGWRACVRAIRRGDGSGAAALAGAILFIFSDSMIAWDKFHQHFWWKELGVMSTYYAAQTLIALSVVLAAGKKKAGQQMIAADRPVASS